VNRLYPGNKGSLAITLIALFVACAPKPRTMEGPPYIAPDSEKAGIRVNKSEWSWVDRQGMTRSYERVSSRLREIMTEYGNPGLSIVLKQGRFYDLNPDVFHFDMDFEAAASGKPINARTVFQANRLGQTIIAYLVLKLVTDGKLDLDRPLSKYVPRSSIENSIYDDMARDDRYSRLTARRILSHQSGLANSRLDHPEQKLTFIAPPGKGFTYSGEGYGYLQFILEQMFSEGLDELAKAYVLDPFGMRESKFSRQTHSVMASANTRNGSTSSNLHTGWAFFTTAQDFTNFMWDVKVGGGELSYEAFMSYIIYPTVRIRSSSILATSRSEGKPILPPHLAWCLGWGTYQMPRVELGACPFMGEKGHETESYATVFTSSHSTALTIFLIPSSSRSAMPLVLKEILGDMDNPLCWLGF
jgi:CubicO group peptidase (beta-lactamase class C family)